jgi:hypothetical protein
LNFCVKFIKKSSNGLIDIHLTNFFKFCDKKNQNGQVKHKVEHCSTQWLHCTLTVQLDSLPAWLAGAVNNNNREFVVVVVVGGGSWGKNVV